MRMLVITRTIFDSWYLGSAGLYTGTPLEIVLAMKRTTLFGEHTPLAQYLTCHRDRMQRLHGIALAITGDTPDAQAASFLDALLTHGVVRRLRDLTPEGEKAMRKQPIRVPAAVYAGLEAVRRSGLTNMLARDQVIALAEMLGHDAAADWVREHPDQYAQAIFAGLVPEDQTEGAG